MSLIVSILIDAGAYNMDVLGCNAVFSHDQVTGDPERGHIAEDRGAWGLAATRPTSRSVTMSVSHNSFPTHIHLSINSMNRGAAALPSFNSYANPIWGQS